MKTIVGSKRKINPYFAGQVALVTAGYLVLLGLTALFIFLSVTAATDDGAFGWGIAALLASIASITVTCALGTMAYDALEKKRNSWQPYREN